MSDEKFIGGDFSTWSNHHIGKSCLMCGAKIEYTALGMNNGQSEHKLECNCTVIECRSKEVYPDE